MALFPEENQNTYNNRGLVNVPAAGGVYGIYKAGAWIYIGSSGNLAERMADHMRGDQSDPTERCIASHSPTHFTFEVRRDYIEREKYLLSTTVTLCNRKVG